MIFHWMSEEITLEQPPEQDFAILVNKILQLDETDKEYCDTHAYLSNVDNWTRLMENHWTRLVESQKVE